MVGRNNANNMHCIGDLFGPLLAVSSLSPGCILSGCFWPKAAPHLMLDSVSGFDPKRTLTIFNKHKVPFSQVEPNK